MESGGGCNTPSAGRMGVAYTVRYEQRTVAVRTLTMMPLHTATRVRRGGAESEVAVMRWQSPGGSAAASFPSRQHRPFHRTFPPLWKNSYARVWDTPPCTFLLPIDAPPLPCSVPWFIGTLPEMWLAWLAWFAGLSLNSF